MRNKKKLYKYFLSSLVILAFAFSTSSIVNANNTDTGSSDLKVSYHTKAEIANYINNHPYSNAYVNNFSSTPKTSSPYALGSLSSSTLNDTLTLLNTIRYVAGIPSNVTLNSKQIEYAQAASVVDAANNVLSHYPAQPSGMSNDMFQLGYDGAGSSNLAMGFESLGSAMIDGWMSDGDDSNIDRVGHRRWVLNPSMAQTGFGLAYTSDGSYPYSAMYSIDGGNSDGKYYNVVAWPAQNTPSDFFQKNDPWTISFNEYVLNASVTVTNNNTGKSWSFSGTPNCCISNDSGYYFNINNDGYGQIGCIIFRPDNISVSNGNSYSVSLSGEVADEEWAYSEQDGWYISWKSGTERNINISYTVDFFDTQYYLNPNVEYVTVTFSPNGADEIESSITIEKNTAYGSFPTVTRSGFDFVGWYTLPEGGNKVETTDICSQDITLYAHWVVNSSTQYTEKYYTEGLDGNYVLYKSEIKYGEAGSELPIENKNYEGFKLTRITGSVYILEDGSSVKEYYYTRNTYSITWDFDGGNNGNDNNTDSYKYEESITVPTSLTKEGYYLSGWDPSVPSKMPAENLKIKAKWSPRTNTKYTVLHYQETLDGDYDTPYEQIYAEGTTGTSVTPEVRDWEGFISPNPITKTIEADGSTLIVYKYERKSYVLTIDCAGGSLNGYSSSSSNVKYGSPLNIGTPQKEGYTFDGWDIELPKYMPAYALEAKAKWIKNTNPNDGTATYTVEHYIEGLDGEYTKETETISGKVGESILASVKYMQGFTSPTPQTETIKADGSTLIKYQYDRKEYTLTLNFNGGNVNGSSIIINSYKYGTPFEEKIPQRQYYIFDGWDKEFPETMPAENLTIKALWKEDPSYADVSYKVEHYQEQIDGEMVLVSEDTETFTAMAGSSVTPDVKTYNGFLSSAPKTVTVSADGSTVVQYFYTRKSYTLTWDLNGGSASGNYTGRTNSGKVMWGVSITEPKVSKEGYTFAGWDIDVPDTMPMEDLTITAQWIEKSNEEETASYRVEHYQEKLDGSYTIVKSDTQNEVGKVGSSITPEVKSYTGFDSPTTITTTINQDGSTVVEYYYTRKSYKLTWDLNGGSASGSFTGNSSVNGSCYSGDVKYGTKITVPAVSKTNCIFDKWDVETPETMPAKDLTIKANWADLIVSYKVEHYQENLDGSFTLMTDDTQILSGKAGSTVSPQKMDYPGFSVSSQTVTLKADGSTVVQYRYKRNLINLTWNFAGGSSKGNYSYGYIKYGMKITAPTVTKKGYIFDGWDVEVPATMPAKPLTITAKWKEDTSNNNNNNLKHIEAKEPTCDKDGNKEYWHSEEQGKYYSDENGQNEIVKDSWVITALGHKWNNGVVTKEATETAEGTMLFTCERCSESYTDSIPAKGHEHNLKYENAKAATCAKAGNSEYWYCDKCGKYYSDKNASKQIAKDSYIIAATGHKWDSGVVTKEATENAEGEKTFTCSICGETYTESISKLEPANPVKAFVTRFYTIILQREEINDEEIEYYTSRLLSHELDGCSVAKGFVMSPEYTGKGEDNLTFVNKMYAAFFNREADAAEFYVNLLESGQSREVVLAGFVNSPEFKALCADYGINPGEMVIESNNQGNNGENNGNNQGNNGENNGNNQGNNQGNNPSDDVTKLNLDTTNVDPDKLDAYVKNLYVQILGREYDEGGLQYWKEQIMAGTTYDAATAARVGFFESPEYQGKNKNSEQFVTDCYHAFLGREPEADGLTYWTEKLESGEYSKQKVIDLGFGHSNEFKGILTECGFRIIE